MLPCVVQSAAAAEATKPVVAFVQYNSFEPAAFQIDFAQYKADYTKVRHPGLRAQSRTPLC